jgi:GNAT superfamily N-acetyltransferase
LYDNHIGYRAEVTKMRITYMADHPEAVPHLAAGFKAQWGIYFSRRSVEAIAADFEEYLCRDGLPLSLVALDDADRALGTATLRTDSITSRPSLGPWLAAFYVAPDRRNAGVGTRLVRAVEWEARRLGYTELYAGTSRAATLFARLSGWTAVERLAYHGEDVTIFRCDLLASPMGDGP